MSKLPSLARRRFLEAAACTTLAACGSPGRTGASATAADTVPAAQIDAALARLDALASELMARTRLPGMAVAVVRDDRIVYAKGFGTRLVETDAPVDADTVFQLASVSKSVGATVVAREVGRGTVKWDTPMHTLQPWFALSDATVTRELTIGDLYAHRSGLPDHAGDRLEDMGYAQREVLERLRFLPLGPFRKSYHYTNFGLTAAGVAVAVAAGTDWATLSEQAIYTPLGMHRTSSRYADFEGRTNRAIGHFKIDGRWVRGLVRMPDAQAPAASVSSSVNDMAKWLLMMLGEGTYARKRVVDADALAPAISPQIESSPASAGRAAGYYGYGFNVGTTAAGRKTYGHSGAFYSGAATAFKVVPATGLGIVVLTNGYPMGIPETLIAQFFDLVEFGAPQRDWVALYTAAFAPMLAPEGSLVGVARPAAPTPARPLVAYVGTYRNEYYGPLIVGLDLRGLVLSLGPTPLKLPLAHWDGDVFTFGLLDENAPSGTISKVTFAGERVTIEYYDKERLGTWVR
jgi:CubicO group peptidase (beta-lactamase class C family)